MQQPVHDAQINQFCNKSKLAIVSDSQLVFCIVCLEYNHKNCFVTSLLIEYISMRKKFK